MKGCAQWNPVYGGVDFFFKRESNKWSVLKALSTVVPIIHLTAMYILKIQRQSTIICQPIIFSNFSRSFYCPRSVPGAFNWAITFKKLTGY